MKRREFITLVGGTVIAWPLRARAQQPAKMPTVGLISPLTQAAAAGNVAEFRRGLRDLGYVEGRNIALDLRFADGIPERLPELAASLVAAKPDVIFVGSSAGIVATQKATQTIPLIMITLEDPIALGLIKSLARPGTNITGTWHGGGEALVGKRLAILRDLAPGTMRVGALINPRDPTDAPTSRLLPGAARALGLDLHVFEVPAASKLDDAFASAARASVQALFVSQTPLFLTARREIVATVARLQVPAVYGWREFAEAGGLASYGANLPDIYRRSAGVIDKILKGANPADLPVEIPTRFELVVNLKAAKAIGLTISDSFLLLADEVIE